MDSFAWLGSSAAELQTRENKFLHGREEKNLPIIAREDKPIPREKSKVDNPVRSRVDPVDPRLKCHSP